MQGLTENYVGVGLDLNLSQFRSSPKLNAFLTALLSPYAGLQTALADLIEKRHLDTAQGRQLDGIGDIVGVARPYVDMSNKWYFGFTGQTKAKGFSQAPIRDAGVLTLSAQYSYMSDAAYRNLIRWKIIANNSHGTTEDIIRACIVLFEAKKVEVQTQAAQVKVIITKSKWSNTSAFENKPEQWIPSVAGVSVNVEFIKL